ncbi:MAG: restriction endonuclease subunit S [Bacteroidales bacterium]|nr:restriction endonuclease subunit S [Bacteroidales bacterium]
MSKKKKLIPELRFPEFKNEGEWEIKSIGDIAISQSSSMALNKLELKSNGYPVYGADSIVGFIDEHQQSETYISIVKDGSGVGRLKLCQSYSSILGTLTCLKSKNNKQYHLDWLYYLLTTVDFSVYVKGAGIPHIYFSDFKNQNVPIPNPKEQQKVAFCLSSLDELIEAHSQKLDLLKVHKNGLMQNLFPIEGEKVPKYRFPEFKKDEVWTEKSLDEVATILKGKGISKADIVEDGDLPCIRYGELYTHYKETIRTVKSYTNSNAEDLVLSKANDVIIPASGETQIDIATASCVLESGIALGGDLNIIRSKINGVFLSYYLNNAKKHDIAQMAQGIAVVHLYPNQLKTLKLKIPNPKEQQKIALCLSTLEEIITELTEKIEQLKQHKNGLMQGLFPKMID